jgi:alkylation response protein AidB-like acyl-CoA dehydrogenase
MKRMDSGDLEMVLETLRDFAAREAPLSRRLEWDRADECPEEVVRAMLGPEVGLHLVFIPEEHGGLGGGAYDLFRMSEEFARIDLGLATALLAIALGTDPIRVGATPEQAARFLPRIAEEGLVVAYAVTEPEAGSNVESLKTVAEPVVEDGRVVSYRLSGVKQFISNGGIADLYTILARTPGGSAFFVVERNSPGLTAGPHEVKHGIRLSNTAQVVLEDVSVPAANLLGGVEGEGLRQANRVFGFTRLMVAGFGLGAGSAALDRAIAYSKERRQFGSLLRDLQGYTHKLLVPHAIRLAAARAYVEHVADLLDGGDTDRQVEGSVAKLFATEAANRAADDAVQALGGYGYCTEYEVEKIRRDARILTIYEGTSEIQQSIIGIFRVRETVRGRGAFYEELAAGVEALADAGGPGIARAARFLGETVALAFRTRLTREQHALFTFAGLMAETECAAALARAAARSGDPVRAAMARAFSAEVAFEVPSRILRLFAAAGRLSEPELADLCGRADLPGALELGRGRLADLDRVAAAITA